MVQRKTEAHLHRHLLWMHLVAINLHLPLNAPELCSESAVVVGHPAGRQGRRHHACLSGSSYESILAHRWEISAPSAPLVSFSRDCRIVAGPWPQQLLLLWNGLPRAHDI